MFSRFENLFNHLKNAHNYIILPKYHANAKRLCAVQLDKAPSPYYYFLVFRLQTVDAEKAEYIARKTLSKTKKKLGLLPEIR